MGIQFWKWNVSFKKLSFFFFFFSRNRRNFVNVVRLKFFEPKIGNFGIEWILIFVKLPAFFSSKWCNWRNFVNIT